MLKEEFINLFTAVVLPLFTGSEIIGEEESSARDFEVAQGTNGTMLVKAQKSDEYRLIIKRNQPFKNKDINFVKAILNELMLISSYNINEISYVKKLRQTAIEKAICMSLSETSFKTLLDLISEISKWSERTYEGNKLTFGFVINENSSEPAKSGLHFSSLLSNDFMALLSDGKKSTIELDKNGYLIGYSIFDRQKSVSTLTPFRYIPFAKFCNDKRIGITLYENGDMLIFKNYSLLFAKRRGIWNSYDHENFIDLLSNKQNYTMKEIRRSIYMTSLDVSFEGAGGCIAYVNKDSSLNVLNHIDINDILTEKHFEMKKQLELDESQKLYNILNSDKLSDKYNKTFSDYIHDNKCIKTATLASIINGKKFHELNRKLREELVSIDGATVIDSDGTIITVGAIIRIEAGSTGGGRLAATKTLSKYGISIKISTDGIIQGYTYDKRQNNSKPIFTIG